MGKASHTPVGLREVDTFKSASGSKVFDKCVIVCGVIHYKCCNLKSSVNIRLNGWKGAVGEKAYIPVPEFYISQGYPKQRWPCFHRNVRPQARRNRLSIPLKDLISLLDTWMEY
jgi:hypothetical protein